MKLSRSELLDEKAYAGAGGIARETRRFTVKNPASGAVLASLPNMDSGHAAAAIERANAAWPAWRALLAQERARLLRRWHDLILEHQEDLAAIMTAEQGKPLAEARGEIGFAARFVEWCAEDAKRVYGDVIPSPQQGWRTFVLKEPAGVAALITPWNFPAAMVTRKAATALAAGCPVVLKPSDFTPLSAVALVNLAIEAGIPADVFGLVTCDREHVADVGTQLATHPDVRVVSFTGSTAVGKRLMAQAASTVKKVSLELGGNAPFIVLADADLDNAVAEVVRSKFRNMGQACVAANRIFVHETIYDAFAQRLVEAARDLRIGDGAEEGVEQGPLINEAAIAKVEAHIRVAFEHGAQVLCGGERHGRTGNFFEPTVLSEVVIGTSFDDEETFGPVAPLYRFSEVEEVIALSNESRYGLAAYVFGRDIQKVWRVAEALEVGVVGINAGVVGSEVAPLGGRKESGVGREGSRYGIEEFLETKYVCLAGI
ncbi:NAD-dependent succinate-semialdehyde dehydrogenase [Ancylobacter sp. A5.8]|uniref:NAD-dependent succinate-semialdehyde dehydrogenase n=1 Tax=Ancylobacter gelatini TaxID=2919920 RepID=UPI001F4ED5A9|nr:NAD-dependent succinate-semialdehyde dehydrogenase [Ancylobacter gelatini]MCJ8143292.1 NAD-dependent succinate-semialdehyde dehydrogenase [Ancylobacter gelatini]